MEGQGEQAPEQEGELTEEQLNQLMQFESKLSQAECNIDDLMEKIQAMTQQDLQQELNEDVMNLLADQNVSPDIKDQDIKGTLQDNYIDLYTSARKLDQQSQLMKQELFRKNKTISALAQ